MQPAKAAKGTTAKASKSSAAKASSAGGTAGNNKKGKDDVVKGPKPKALKVQVHILEVKDIRPPDGVVPDLVVTASVGNLATKYTQVVRQSTSCQFDTLLEWKFMMTYQEMQMATLTLNVLNANTEAKTESLGMYEVKLSQIRKQPLGEYFMAWLALYTDPEEYVSEITGRLRCTMTCLGGSQPIPTHTLEEIEEAENDETPMVLMPHRVRWTHYALYVAIYRVEGLPNMDEFGSTDAFVSVKIPGCAAVKTKVFENSLKPIFNELLRLPVKLPMMMDTLTISVSDFDQGGYDDLVADTTFSLNEVVKQGEIAPHWIPLYGIKGNEGLDKIRAKLPHVPLDTCYKGRLLLALKAEEVPTKLPPKQKTIGPCSDPDSEPFIIRFDLYQASQLDARLVLDNTQIQIELQVGGINMYSSTGLAEHGHVRWDEMFEETKVDLPSDLKQCPDIFINVNYTTTTSATAERLGYIRLDLEDVCGFNHAPQWETMLRDPLFPNVSAVPGFLEYRLDFGKQSELPRSERERIVQPMMRRFELRAHIYQARNLPSMDEDGLANPYAVVTLQGFAGHTGVAEPTCDPQWYETVQIDLKLPQPTPVSSQILLRVYDMEAGDAVGGDQLIGKCYVPLLGVDRTMPSKPTWVDIWMKEPADVRGQVLCCFQLISFEELHKVPKNDITPPMRDVEIEVNVIGVRELLPYNNAPISSPIVEIDTGDRSTPDKVRATRPSSTPSGADANFLETLTIHTRLPEELLYIPNLNVRIFDLRGIDNKPVIAKCSIPLGKYCEWIKEAAYVPNSRPRVPAVPISDELSEASEEDEEDVDTAYEERRRTIPHQLFECNFNIEPELKLETPTVAELRAIRASQRRGRLNLHRHRTLPPTPAMVPLGLVEAEADEDAKVDKALDAELEHIIIDQPFDEWDVHRGMGMDTQEDGGLATRDVGKFKARIRIVEAELKSKAAPPLNLMDLFEQSVYITRLYVTKGIKLTPTDEDGLADPFIIVRNGKHKQNVYDDIANTRYNTLNPNFYRCYELPTMIPGNPTLTIEVWDKDVGGAQLIGSTSIDIENRIFSQEWLELNPKPVERRYLWSPASLSPQGKLECWVEILSPQQALATRKKQLRPPDALECQLRVVIWSITELEYRGKSNAIEFDGAANVFVTAQAGNGPVQETDVHYGARENANFNWRLLFDVSMPTRYTKLSVQVWDTRSTDANESLAECTLQLRTLYQNVQKARRVHEIPRQFYKCTHPFYPGQQAKIDMSISMMPRDVAEQLENIAGPGRSKPNKAPYLPPPARAGQTALAKAATRSLRLTRKGADTEPDGWSAAPSRMRPAGSIVVNQNSTSLGQAAPRVSGMAAHGAAHIDGALAEPQGSPSRGIWGLFRRNRSSTSSSRLNYKEAPVYSTQPAMSNASALSDEQGVQPTIARDPSSSAAAAT